MDKVIIEYEARTAEAAEGVEQLKTKTSEAGDASKKASKEATDGFKDQEKAMGSASSLIDKVFPIKMVQGYAQQVQTATRAMFGLTGATKGATVAAKAKVVALKLLRGALIATGIGAIVVLLGSLVAWLSRTTEGADFLARKMAFVGEIFDTLGGMAADLGGKIVALFEDPMGALESFGDAVKDNIMTRLTGLLKFIPRIGTAIKQLFEGDFAGAGKTAADAVGAIVIGVESVTDTIQNGKKHVGGLINQLWDAGTAAEILSDKQRQLERDQGAFNVTKEEGNKIVAEAMNLARDEDLSIQERDKALKEASKVQEGLMATEIKLAERRKQLAIEDADLTDNQDKRREMKEKAEIDFLKTQQRHANEQRTLRRFENTIANQAQKEQEDINQRKIESELEVTKLQAKTVEERIEAIKDERDIAVKQEGLMASEIKAIRLKADAEIEELIEEERIREEEAAAEKTKAELEHQKRKSEALIKTAELHAQTMQEEIAVEEMKLRHQLENKELLDEEIELLELQHQQRIDEIRNNARDEELQKEEDFRRAMVQISQRAADDVMRIMSNRAQHRIDAIDDLLDRELMSEEQANKKKAAIQQEQAKREKRLAITQSIINTAVAVTNALKTSRALAIAVGIAGGLQTAAIASEPIPSFAEGVIGLRGRGTGKSDSIPAMLSKGESVMTADETKRHRGLFEAIRSGQNITYSNMVRPGEQNDGGTAMNSDQMQKMVGDLFNDEGIRYEIRRSVEEQLNSQGAFAKLLAKETGREITRNNRYK